MNKICTALLASVFTATAPIASVHAGEPSKLVAIEPEAPASKNWAVTLNAAWDSLYMFRGVNVLRGDLDYGSGLFWSDLNATWTLTPDDSIIIGAWYGTATKRLSYQELDLTARYNRTVGNLTLGVGYIAYLVVEPRNLYSHEVNASAAYKISLPANITLTPSLTYYFNIGPNSIDSNGTARAGSSFLASRLDAHIPVFGEKVGLAPWLGASFNFRYNSRQDGTTFNGFNHLEMGLAIPIRVHDSVTISPYGTYSHHWDELSGTRPDTFWGGVKATIAF